MSSPAPVSLLRRLGAIFYDTLLLIAVLLVAGALSLPVTHADLANNHYSLGYRLYLLAVAYLYFAWPWLRRGQTLGMRTWRIQVVQYDGQLIRFHQSLLRFAGAILSWLCLGLGFWWALFDKEKRTWHDILSRTYLVRATD